MRVSEIAKAAGVDNATVLGELGLEQGKGAHMRDVEDGEAEAYIAAKEGRGAGGSRG